MSEDCDRFFLAVVCLEDSRPLRPRVVCSTLNRRFRHHLKLCHRFCAKTDGSSYAVISCITTTDDKDMFAFCQFIWNFFEVAVEKCLCDHSEEVYCEIDPFCLSSRHFDVTRVGRSAGKHDSVILFQQVFCLDVLAYVCIEDKFYPLFFHETDPSVYYRFLQFHVRNTVAEKSARAVASFIDCNTVASSIELLCCCKSGWTASDHGDGLAGADIRFLRLDPAFFVSGLNDRSFVFLCGNRLSV